MASSRQIAAEIFHYKYCERDSRACKLPAYVPHLIDRAGFAKTLRCAVIGFGVACAVGDAREKWEWGFSKGLAEMDAKLRILSGPTSGELIAVSGGRLLVGRDEECHLKPVSEFVSRHHCVLLLDEFTFRVQDLGSKNGTFVNGRRIGAGETILLHDDLVAIGEIICQIDLTQADGKRPSAPQAETLSLATPALIATDVFEGDTVQPDFSLKNSSNSDRGGPSTPSPDAGTNTEMPKSTGQ